MSHPAYEEPLTTAPASAGGVEPCPACGAPLASDQRYCMACGTRRPAARIDFLDVLADEPGAGVRAASAPPTSVWAEPAAAPPRGFDGWLRANGHLLALGALVMATLLVGLVVGHWVAGSTPAVAPAPAPQVIRITGGQAAAPAATTTAPAATTDAGSGTTPAKQKSPPAKESGAAATPKGASNVGKLSKKQLDNAVKKGQPITTGSGKAPPKDDTPAGGGSDFPTIC